MLTSAGSGKVEVLAGTTVGGRDLVIVTDPMGYYRIEARGVGAPLGITEEKFTSLALARRRLESWYRANAAQFAKEELKNRIATGPSLKEQRKAEALALKNGELTVPTEDETE